jgi:hypothetical protein
VNSKRMVAEMDALRWQGERKTRCVVCGTAIDRPKVMCATDWAVLPLRAQEQIAACWALNPEGRDFAAVVTKAVRYVRSKRAAGPRIV